MPAAAEEEEEEKEGWIEGKRGPRCTTLPTLVMLLLVMAVSCEALLVLLTVVMALVMQQCTADHRKRAVQARTGPSCVQAAEQQRPGRPRAHARLRP